MFASRIFVPVTLLSTIVLIAVVSCEQATAPADVVIPSGAQSLLVDVRWQHPFPQGNDLNRMWGFADGSFFAVGDAGTVLHFDGATWTLVETPVREDLHGIWASSPSDVYAGGFGGTLIHYDGHNWIKVATPTKSDFYAVSVNLPNDIFVTGLGGSVWNRFNGTWTEYAVAPGQRLRTLLSYSHNEVYVGGSNASLYRFNGTSWSKIQVGLNLPGDNEFRDMWGPGAGMYSFLSGRAAVWTDGSAWGVLGEANGYYAYGLWGVSFDNQVMVAAGLSTHLIDGVAQWFATPTPEPLYDVWGPAKNNYYAVGRSGNIAHFDGSGWQAINQGLTKDIRDLWFSPSGAIAVGAEGAILRQSGTQWIASTIDPGYDLSGVWEDGGLTVAVGRFSPNGRDWRQAILTNTGGGWTDVGPIGSAYQLFDVWGSSPTDIYAVGWGGEVVRFNGASWSEVVPDGGEMAALRSISGTSPTNVIAVGRTNDLRGLVVRYDGNGWSVWEHNGSEELYGVWVESPTSAFAVGSLGKILRLNGNTWSLMTTPTSEALFSVWGTSSNNVYAAGWEGTLLHFDGSTWTPCLPPTNRTFGSVSGRSSSEIYLSGDGGMILRFDGL